MILDPIDQNIRNQGFNFVPFDKYLADGFQPKTLDMSGGISTLPMSSSMVPLILNPSEGGGDGSGGITTAPNNSGFDYEFDALGGLNNPDNVGLTEEEQDALDKVQNPGFTKGQIGSLGLQGFFNPLGAIINTYRTQKKNEAAAIEAAKAAAQAADEARQAERARAANPGVYARADAMGFTDGRGGGFGSRSTGTNENFSNETGRGRTGYSEGGLATMFTRRR